jgi:hypothetical protein
MVAIGHENLAGLPAPLTENLGPAQLSAKELLLRKAAELTTPGFIERRIIPLVRETLNGQGSDCHVEVIQNTGTGRLTIRYDFGSENVFIAKLYTDELGRHCYLVNRALWDAGFNRTSRYRVPEPVGFLPDCNLLVMRRVPGQPLADALRGDASVDLVAASRQAAEWLTVLHCSPLRLGAAEPDWDSMKLFRMAIRLVKAPAAHPENLDLVRDLLHLLEDRITKLPRNRPLVFTHGRYHHDHVFVSADATSVIDLDRCRPSDPAKDAAEFIRVLRLTAFKQGFDMLHADRATRAFLDTYWAGVPHAASSLGCYWATFVFHSLLGGLKKGRSKGSKSWEELLAFYVSEMKRALDLDR